jgi:allantoicase
MPPPTPQSPRDAATSAEQAEAAQFYKQLEENGQLVNVDSNTDVSALPAKVTHVRYPDGTVKRIRFTSSVY